ncbi:GntR family transcriptional regulator [Algimonas porphyrae]|uniref:Histidine utilization repressor n=1 Tax=Algimonas porphyrae TaxID=1128113 RepID=A0ABQ5V1G2_9PROT|nr:UTRA domain-containing protein [Algimonas porphyrae]GLQ21393.1 histidine utilization repressor [Algimonas porphyrae]
MRATQADIRKRLIDRIQSGEWPLGSRIPDESDLAEEYGCARATMNRALQALATEGLVIRKRKGGTRVSLRPVRHARVAIPVIRDQVEALGETYTHRIVTQETRLPPETIRDTLQLHAQQDALFIETLHCADDRPFAFERRWVNLDAVPDIRNAPLETISANEWLVQTVPFSDGQVTFTAVALDTALAVLFDTAPRTASFTIYRTTQIDDRFITAMTLHYQPGYELRTAL